MEEAIMGKILFAIKNGARFYTEIEKESNVSPVTLSKYLREMEQEGLIRCELDKRKKRVYYVLNPDRSREIEELIREYLNKEFESIAKKLTIILKLPTFTEEDVQKVRDIISLIKTRIEEYTSTESQ